MLFIGVECMGSSGVTLLQGAERGFAAERELYRQALEAADTRDRETFNRLRGELHAYPLAPYLDYRAQMAAVYNTRGVAARAFVDAHADGPLGVRYLGHYLAAAGKGRRWTDYRAATTREPHSERLRCYYGRSLLAGGEKTAAWELARRLWLSESSVDKACDPLFVAFRKAGNLDDELVWQRALLAFAAREGSLLRYIASRGSVKLANDLEQLRRSYQEPHRTRVLAPQASAQRRGDVLLHGLERLSRYDPGKALKQRQSLDAQALDDKQWARLDKAIAFRALLERDEATRPWIDSQLSSWRDDKLSSMRLRWAIAEEDWDGLLRHQAALSVSAQGEALWRYWRARGMAATGSEDEARTLFSQAAEERSYYGFLSADRLGLPYSYEDSSRDTSRGVSEDEATETTPQEPLLAPMRDMLLRVHELLMIGDARLAHAEWTHALQRLKPAGQLRLAELAQSQGWHRLAIDAANAGLQWDRLELRFPLAYEEDFRSRAAAYALPMSELMAIARRESAFFPMARSPVGARGLMQLMPATGMSVARKAGISLKVSDFYTVGHNLDLGSAYYLQLLERFKGNRAVALAAYNAGPNRVQNWIGKGLPLDAWIETIPYGETRAYVKAVLAYSVVFDYRLGETGQLLTVAERLSSY
ncbi:MAG: soluble lytic murein transglycosylase [Halieaceae bacterium]|jgi:soluble lytic murein transglycosylase